VVNWFIMMLKEIHYNPLNRIHCLQKVPSDAETAECNSCIRYDILSNGFKLRNTWQWFNAIVVQHISTWHLQKTPLFHQQEYQW
jgi:hypothetical protein